MRTSGATCLVSLFLLSLVGACSASDHGNTDEGLPIEIEDAYPIKYRAVEFQFAARYEDLDDAGSRGVFVPELKAGLFRNAHVWLGGTILTNEDEDDSSAKLGVLYNFNAETLSTPAFSISGEAEWDLDGAPDIRVRGIITRSWGHHRFNLNADYIDVGSPNPDDRRSRYRFGLGWDHSMRLDTLLLADIVVEKPEDAGEGTETFAEAGLRYQLDPDTVLAAGVGVGLSGGSGSRDFTATLGLSRSF